MDDGLTNQAEAVISGIASDNLSGAAEVLRRAAAVFSQMNADQIDVASQSVEVARRSMTEICVALAKAQPSMSPLLRLASEALSEARAATSASEAWEYAANAAFKFVETASRAAHRVVLHASSLISTGSTILTHSRSSTVVATLAEARRAGRLLTVVATESRPLFEGRRLASELAEKAIAVISIADAAASLLMDRVDLVLIGADKITPESLINKTGTRMIVLAARERGLPVYALCDSSKFIAADYCAAVARDEREGNELWPGAPEQVTIVNRYFEPTPLAYFTGIVTEDGVLTAPEVARQAGTVGIDAILRAALEALREGVK